MLARLAALLRAVLLLAALLDEAVVVFVWVASAGAACAWCLTEGGVVG